MVGRNVSGIFMTLLLVCAMTLTFLIPVHAGTSHQKSSGDQFLNLDAKATLNPPVSIWIDPPTITVPYIPGYKFNITVWLNTANSTVSQAVFCWQIMLTFNSTLLFCTNVGYTGGSRSQFFAGLSTIPISPTIAAGSVTHAETLIGSGSKSGNGSLCWIEFQSLVIPEKTLQTSFTLNFTDPNGGTFLLDPDLNTIDDVSLYAGEVVFRRTVHNLNDGIDYANIQEAINAEETQDGHIIFAESRDYYENVVVNKSIALIGENKETTVLHGGGAGNTVSIYADHVNLTGFTIRNSDQSPHHGNGLVLDHVEICNVTGNRITGYDNGFFLDSSSDNLFNANIVGGNDIGFALSDSYNNLLDANAIADNGVGVSLTFSKDNSLSANDIVNNDLGVNLDESSHNSLTKNEIANCNIGVAVANSTHNNLNMNNVTNNNVGVALDNSTHNNLTLNHFANNGVGVSLAFSSNNSFAGNVFANAAQVNTHNSANLWDAGYPTGGNYWNWSVALDEKNGPAQDQEGGDGIGDSPYIIDVDNVDRYPLLFAKLSFTISPSDPIADITTLAFNATDSIEFTEPIIKFKWDFGDGSRDTGVAVTHVFLDYGIYNVTLTAILPYCTVYYLTKQVAVKETPRAGFVFIPSSNIYAAVPLTFDASRSSPLGGIITSYRWDFGDGDAILVTFPVTNHTYTKAGTFNVELTVTDSEGLSSSTSARIFVKMPIILSLSTSSLSSLVGYRVDVTGTLTDVVGNRLKNETVVLYYTFGGITTWIPVTSDATDNSGNYEVVWIPPATGSFTLKVEWQGNATHVKATSTTLLYSLGFDNRHVFSVESNSTITGLAFDAVNGELGFVASGQPDTRGTVKVTFPRVLAADSSKVKVVIDGTHTDFTLYQIDDSWQVSFNCTYSSHQVAIRLGEAPIPEFESVLFLSLFMLAILTGVLVYKRKHRAHGSGNHVSFFMIQPFEVTCAAQFSFTQEKTLRTR